ncbi:DNA repair protein XRCC4 isoform X2 [Electrophorus electricus]|uniref:DNA repair protein XRCC4 isoform X2 n=1 Tax=Electrophorus electricus TaxID=8005 RepID=UPI0015CF9817|nr:DNA repair protein XRCC4 isoform X2 [Electrophorus electricus]XP_026887019.2 DNA repair protein XRCC4 isoform X2 [Electrophorus electricus]XP_035391784.1 DNA repair protein XRCC4 isoform X2 [Electrophorus electricus]
MKVTVRQISTASKLSEEDVTREAQEMEMPRERYVQELELALTEEGQTAQKYSFHLTPEKAGGPKLQLFYDKVESDISFKLGVVELLPVPEPTKVIRELISYGLERSTHVQVENHHLHEENQRLKSEQEHITSELERYVRQKETLEKDLYSRFVLVLNEKKAKIRTFQETIKQLQDTIEAEKQRLNSEAVGCVEYRFAGDEPEEENYYGSTTDEEGPGDPKLPPAKLHNKELLAKNPLDDRLNDMTDVAPSRKRRCRHLQQLKSQTKKAALEQHKSSRNELHQEAKAEVSQLPAVQHAQVSPDPDDLFDDI